MSSELAAFILGLYVGAFILIVIALHKSFTHKD